MITKKEYLKAQKVVDQYKSEQLLLHGISNCVDCGKPLIDMYELLDGEHGDYSCKHCDERYIRVENGSIQHFPWT